MKSTSLGTGRRKKEDKRKKNSEQGQMVGKGVHEILQMCADIKQDSGNDTTCKNRNF